MPLFSPSTRARYLYRLRAMFEYDDDVDLTAMTFIDPGERSHGVQSTGDGVETTVNGVGKVKSSERNRLRRANEFYSSHNEIYRVMLKHDAFLPEPYDALEWFAWRVQRGFNAGSARVQRGLSAGSTRVQRGFNAGSTRLALYGNTMRIQDLISYNGLFT